MKNEKEIFDMYVSDDSRRLILTAPFIQDGYVFASNSCILIRVSTDVIDGTYIHSQKPSCSGLFIETRKELPIDIETLKNLLSKVEQVDEMEEIGEDVECSECNGSGEVTWEYNRWEEDFDCPVCNGTGYSNMTKEVPTGKKVPDPYAAIKLGCKTFKAKYIKVLADTMELLEIHTIVMKYNERVYEYAIFNFDGNTDVILMPYTR